MGIDPGLLISSLDCTQNDRLETFLQQKKNKHLKTFTSKMNTKIFFNIFLQTVRLVSPPDRILVRPVSLAMFRKYQNKNHNEKLVDFDFSVKISIFSRLSSSLVTIVMHRPYQSVKRRKKKRKTMKI